MILSRRGERFLESLLAILGYSLELLQVARPDYAVERIKLNRRTVDRDLVFLAAHPAS
jgi:hypothetical protein